MTEVYRAALAEVTDAEGASHEMLSAAMTAAATFAGIIFGWTITSGLACDRDKRRAGEAMTRNFRTGVDIGKRQAARNLAGEFAGTA